MQTTGPDHTTASAGAPADSPRMHAARRTVIAAIVTAALLASVAACERDAAADPLAGSEPDGFTVSDAPVLVLEDDGTEEKLFTRVAARRTPAGEIVVADLGTSEIRVFGRDGGLVRTLARRGKGPGELEGEVRVASRADTIYTFGRPPMSPPDVNVFVAGSGFVARFRPQPANAGAVMAVDRLATGHLVVERGSGFRVLGSIAEAGTLVPDTVVYGLLDASGGTARGDVAWLPPVVRGWTITHPWPRGPVPTTMAGFALGARTSIAASGDRLWVVDGATGQLRAFDGAGREVASGRIAVEPRPFDPALLERRRARDLAAATRAMDSARVVATFDASVRPAAAPVADSALAGPDGELWVRLFDLDDAAPRRFVVVSRDGAEVGRATLPVGLEVHQIGRDFVLGVRRDSLGVESVHEHVVHRE